MAGMEIQTDLITFFPPSDSNVFAVETITREPCYKAIFSEVQW